MLIYSNRRQQSFWNPTGSKLRLAAEGGDGELVSQVATENKAPVYGKLTPSVKDICITVVAFAIVIGVCCFPLH